MSMVHLYRPQRTDPAVLEQILVAREPILCEILERLERWQSGASRQHYLLIGPRGIGKTNLLRLAAGRILGRPELARRWQPIHFAEDFYGIQRVSDLLLETVRLLGAETGLEYLERAYDAVRYQDDEDLVCDRCLDACRRFHGETSRGLLLMIENLDRVLERQMRRGREPHRLRRILIEEDWLVTLCTSPTYLDAVARPEEPFFDFFHIIHLPELSFAEQKEMLAKLARLEGYDELCERIETFESRVRALYHFTGGNPRLTVMLYELIARRNIRSVREGLDHLLDQLTPFYQDRMKDLSEQEARLLEQMALLPLGCTPTELAEASRLPAKTVRAALSRLKQGGYVRQGRRRKKKTVYTLPERFFRIWIQMNHSRAERGRIQYLLEFFAAWYAEREDRDRVWGELLALYRESQQVRDEEGSQDLSEYMRYLIAIAEGSERLERLGERIVVALEQARGEPPGEALEELDRQFQRDADYFYMRAAIASFQPEETIRSFLECLRRDRGYLETLRHLTSLSPSFRPSLCAAIAVAIADPDALAEHLRAQMSRPEDEARISATYLTGCLNILGIGEARELLRSALSDDSLLIRTTAAWALATRDPAKVEPCYAAATTDLEKVSAAGFATEAARVFFWPLFHLDKYDLALRAIARLAAVPGLDPNLLAPYEAAARYLASGKDEAVLEREQPEMQEAIQLLASRAGPDALPPDSLESSLLTLSNLEISALATEFSR